MNKKRRPRLDGFVPAAPRRAGYNGETMTTTVHKTRVGFVGVGLMEWVWRATSPKRASADRFQPHAGEGRRARGRNRLPVADRRAKRGASDIVITMVSTCPTWSRCTFKRTASSRRPGRAWFAPTWARSRGLRAARRSGAAEKGVLFVDAPVSGGSWGATQGTLSIMAGGTEEAFAACLPVFEAMGKKIVHVGALGRARRQTGQSGGRRAEPGSGLRGAALAESKRRERRGRFGCVGRGRGRSWSWTNLGPRIAERDFAPGFKIDHQSRTAPRPGSRRARGLSLPGARLVLENLQTVRRPVGRGEQGTQALITALE
jgi:3-hydroxyisobutyrate dehydrogenase